MTARIIPNGITISTSTSRHTFASFLSRDLAYDQIVKIWDLRKKINSVIPIPLPIDDDDDNGTEDDDSLYEEGDTEEDEEDISSADSAVVLKTPKAESNKPPSASPSPSPPAASSSNSAAAAAAADANQTPEKSARLSPTIAKQRPRSVSDSNYKPRSTASATSTTAVTIPEPKVSPLRQQTVMTPTIKKTRVCPCTVNGEQYPHIALNETYKGSVQAMFRLLFDSNFFPGFLERYENFEHVQSSAWKHGKRQVIGQRRIKSSTTGTRVVKTLFEERRIHRKIPYYTCITAKKSMPDMPMGAVYSIQSRTCITRVSKDKVHVLVTFQVVFSKTGLVSSIIEKNAADDQLRLYSHLNSILNKPELIKELVNDQQLLQDLNLANRPNSNSNSSKSRSSTKKYAGQGWISYAMDWVGSTRLIGFVYFGFFLVLVTHCLLALRLKRITNTLDLVQQQKHLTTHTDSQWIDNKMNRVNQHLNQLKEEVQDYHQRIQKLHNVQ
ncbi:uncharacterized protein EV154DRAFT_536144 [Mucor mucedo]|uniref:uncharacterized protein n=1 Tax=Mucor mucedo TaxID=29922 RepID=UPI00221F66D5|nr:uncharacterized protein EV154DRAFT_536144 [Mucor mucedo]KAI7895289.1 hypothetical protein EV154DRAFT_536144 [Mucor mucedo]